MPYGREELEELATKIHDFEWDCKRCDRRKYRRSCLRYVDAIFEAGRRLREKEDA